MPPTSPSTPARQRNKVLRLNPPTLAELNEGDLVVEINGRPLLVLRPIVVRVSDDATHVFCEDQEEKLPGMVLIAATATPEQRAANRVDARYRPVEVDEVTAVRPIA